jgi:folate-binding protein YgfZ
LELLLFVKNIFYLTPDISLLNYNDLAQTDVYSFFYFWKSIEENGILFLIPTASDFEASFKAYIEHYTFSEQYSLNEILSNSSHSLLFTGHPEARAAYQNLNSNFLLLNHGVQFFGQEWISVIGPEEESKLYLNSLGVSWKTASDFENFRIQHLVAWPGIELLKDSNPLELGLFNSLSGNKGCYPGQEVIEKIISLGSPAKRLCLLERESTGGGPPLHPQLPSLLYATTNSAPSTEAGQLLSLSSSGQALALLRKNYTDTKTPLYLQSGQSFKILKVSAYE